MNIGHKMMCITAFIIFSIVLSIMPVTAIKGSIDPVQAANEKDYDLSKAVTSQGKDELKNQVGRIGGSIVNSARALFVTFFAVAVLFMGVQVAGGGLRDPSRVELIKGGGITATISAVLVYKAEAIVAFVLDILNVPISDIVK